MGHRDGAIRYRTCEAEVLHLLPVSCDHWLMDVRSILGRLVAALVIAGLAVAPLAAQAAANVPARADVSDMASMSGDMPCCPDKSQSKDCQDCPLVAMCVFQTAQAGPSSTEALPLRQAVRTPHSVFDDVLADGLDRPPPDHPPRNLI